MATEPRRINSPSHPMRALIIEDQSTTGEYVIVLDVMLPEMDGWQVLKEMRQAGKQTPVIKLTANDQPEISVSAVK